MRAAVLLLPLVLVLLAIQGVAAGSLQGPGIPLPSTPGVDWYVMSPEVSGLVKASLAMIAVIAAVFVFSLPYVEDSNEGPFEVTVHVLVLKVSFPWKSGCAGLTMLIAAADATLILFERFGGHWLLELSKTLWILDGLSCLVLLLNIFYGLPPLVNRVQASRRLESKN